MIIARYVFFVGISIVLCSGCVRSFDVQGGSGRLFYEDGPQSLVSLCYVRSCGWRLLSESPCASAGSFQVQELLLTRAPHAEYCYPLRKQRGILPFFVRNERGGTLLFAKGYEFVVLGGDDHSWWVQTRREAQEFADAYPYYNANLELTFGEQVQDGWKVTWHKLPSEPADPARGVQMNHERLDYLLRHQTLWRQLEQAADSEETRGAVMVIFESVAAMIQAHEVLWPEFEWNDEQKRIRALCLKYASRQPQ